MNKLAKAGLAAAAMSAAVTGMAPRTTASSHREALAVLNEPCADNTDTYAWVSDRHARQAVSDHELQPAARAGPGQPGPARVQRLPLRVPHRQGREPEGQAGLPRRVHEHAASPRRAPSADRSARRRQRAALAADRRHRDDEGHAHRRRSDDDRRAPMEDDDDGRAMVLGRNLAGAAEQPRTADRPPGLSASGRSRATTRATRPAARSASTTSRSSTPSSTRLRTAAASSPASSTIPISSTRRASSTSST